MDAELDDGQTQRTTRESLDAVASIDPDQFDWNAFCGTYKGRALITRLAFIPAAVSAASSPPPQALRLAYAAALRAIPVIKAETFDSTLYLELVGKIGSILRAQDTKPTAADGDEPMDVDTAHGRKGSEAEGQPDTAWVEETVAKRDQVANRLAVELGGYLSNLIQESIRLTYLAQAQLALKSGSLADALKAFQLAREHSNGPAQQVELGLGIVESALQFIDVAPLSGNVTKIDASLDRLHPAVGGSSGPAITSTMTQAQVQQARDNSTRSQKARRDVGVKLRVAKGLLALRRKQYEAAATELGGIGEQGGLGDWEGEAISSADLALITAICSMASCSRAVLREKLLERPSFHSSVDDSQSWILDILRAFVDAQYGDALAILTKAEPFLLLNPFLSQHTPSLIGEIRTRALVQYLTPFSSVRVSAMASAFGADEAAMLSEVCTLAENGSITARIDLVDRILSLPTKDPRASAFHSAVRHGVKITAQTQDKMFRMRMLEAEVCVAEERPASSGPSRFKSKTQVGRTGSQAGGSRNE